MITPIILAALIASPTPTALPPSGLMVDLLGDPARSEISNAQPRFSWIVKDSAPNAHQEGFQILVASSLGTLEADDGDAWDSGAPNPGGGWTTDARSVAVTYDGPPLKPDTTYHWKVRTWNGPNNVSLWSEPQTFRTGKLTSPDKADTDTAQLTVTKQTPEFVARTAPGHWFIDFGKAAFGTVELTVDSPDARTIEVHLGEVPDGPLRINRAPGGTRRYQVIPLEIRPGEHSYQVEIPADERNTRDFAIHMPDEVFEVYPFRYVEIVNHPGTLRRDDIVQRMVDYPFDDDAARFTSSSKVLNDVWELCHYTMKATSFCGYYVDGDRERIPYEADAYINQLGHYACDREYAMARRTHEYLLTTPTWPTEWILDSVLMAWKDYQFTGNPDSLNRHYDTLKAKTLMALARKDGLISTENINKEDDVLEGIHFTGRSAEFFEKGIRDIVDWPQSERDDFDMRPINAVVNAFHYEAVNRMADIAGAVGNDADHDSLARRAEQIRKSFAKVFIDPETGLVRDGEGSEHSSLHANMFALAFDLVPEGNRSRVLAHLRAKGMACSVYGSQFLLEGLYAAGDAEHALDLLTSTGERSWAHMVYDVGTTIATEAWDDRLKPNQDWNHAWGAAPANIIPHYLMGVRPLTPGFGQILIHPQPGGLAWAELTTPTIRGPVTVRFNQSESGGIHLETETPANTTTRVMLPYPGDEPAQVTIDGRKVHPRQAGGALIFDGVGSGRHHFQVSP